jgi:hypothetical protein
MCRSCVQGKFMPNFVGVGGHNPRVSIIFIHGGHVTHNDNFACWWQGVSWLGPLMRRIIASMYDVPPYRVWAHQLPPNVLELLMVVGIVHGWLVVFDQYTTDWRRESRCWHFRPT